MGSVPAYSATAVITAPTAGQVLASVTCGPGAWATSYIAYYTSSGTMAQPAVGPSGSGNAVADTNSSSSFVTITNSGGTVTAVYVNGVLVGTAAGTYLVPLGGTISMVYTGAPTWVWSYTPPVPITGTASTNVVFSPYGNPTTVSILGGTVTAVYVNGIIVGQGDGVYYIPPGGYISVAFSVAPTWLWTNATPGTGVIGGTLDMDNIALQSDPVSLNSFVTADVLIQQNIFNAPIYETHYLVYATRTVQLIAVGPASSDVIYHVQINAVYPGPVGSFL